ncbi:MAG: oligosaccharide flippase family protein [Clostridia bacterium]|nr:oligosaccharide flippase family protein [Clostridia bacterium]
MSEENNSVTNSENTTSTNEIKTKVIKSAKWTTAQSVINMVYGPLYKIVLAMVISPMGFAYISALLVVLSIGDLLNKIGFSQALIVEKDSGSRQFSTVFWIDLCSSALVSAAIMLCAPWIDSFYELEGLKTMILLVGPCVFVSGLSRTFHCYLQKELRLDITVKIDVLKMVADTVFTVVFIILTKSMIGYVMGTLLSRSLMLICYVIGAFRNGYRMGFHFDIEFIKKVKSFASSVTIRQIFDYLVSKADELIIAATFADKSVLGIYFFAKDLLAKPSQVIISAVSQVALSTLSKFADNVKKVASLYLKMSKYLAIAAFPVLAGLAVTASEFLPAFFGSEYAGAAIYIQCLAVSSMFSTITFAPGSAVLYAMKKPKTVLGLDVLNNSINLLLMLILARFGVIYLLVAKVASTFFSVPVYHTVTRRSVFVSETEYVKSVGIPILASAIMVAVVIGLKLIIPESFGIWIEFIASVAVGASIYIIILITREKNTLKELLSMVKRR